MTHRSLRRIAMRLRRPVLFAFVVIPIGVAAAWANSTTSGEEQRPDGSALLKEARAALPFTLQEPAWLPDGYTVEYVDWYVPDAKLGTTAASVDIWYTAEGRSQVHLWQTNIPDLGEKDPTLVGTSQRLAAETWSVVEELTAIDSAEATQMSARLDDGTTISIDSGLGRADVARMAESLVPSASDR